MSIVGDSIPVVLDSRMYYDVNAKPLPWTCDACGEPCDLTLVVQPVVYVPDPSHRFRSACCEASVQTTKERHANTP